MHNNIANLTEQLGNKIDACEKKRISSDVSFIKKDDYMKFEWDENKNNKKIDKHGIDFNDAITIFDDDNRIEAIDDRNEYGEERLQVIGESKPGVLMVAYTWRHNNTTRRLISARPASKNERALYNQMK